MCGRLQFKLTMDREVQGDCVAEVNGFLLLAVK